MMGKQVKVSVVVPVYNVEAYLRECVDSVLCQTMQNFEVILVDDGATDSSGVICDEYDEQDARIRVIHQPNGGLSVARNTGLDAATGEYVYFLDSDDYIADNTLARLCDKAELEKADVVFFDATVFFDGCEPDPKVYQYHRTKEYATKPGKEQLLELLETDEYRTAVPLMLLRRDYMLRNHLRFRPGILHEDELFTFYVYYANGTVAHCHEEFYARRMRAASIMTGASMCRRYESVYTIYMELSEKYKKKELLGKAADRYLARMSRSVLAKYRLLSENDQLAYADRQEAFKKNVMQNGGYGDSKLKIKCAKGARRFLYRVQYKLRTMLGN